MVASPAVDARRRRSDPLLPLVAAVLALCGGTAALIITRHRSLAGLTALGAAVALVVVASGSTVEPSARARFAWLVLDRVFDASVLLPLAWVERSGSNHEAVLALVGLGASYLASYQRARGQALGYAGEEGGAYRLTRYAILSVGLLFGLIELALWLFAVVTVSAAAVRAWNIVQQDRRRNRIAPPAR
jgi:hypothetical protein